MELKARIRPSGFPLALQIMGLLLGVLIIAQLVTLFLTLVLPPEPPPQYRMLDIARALLGGATEHGGARPLQRSVRGGPPGPSGPGWLSSERSRHELARLLHRSDADVQIYFYLPLPFEGTALGPVRAAEYLMPRRFAARGIHLLSIRFLDKDADGARVRPAGFQVAQAMPRGGGDFPGPRMLPPGAGFPSSPPAPSVPGDAPSGPPRTAPMPGIAPGLPPIAVPGQDPAGAPPANMFPQGPTPPGPATDPSTAAPPAEAPSSPPAMPLAPAVPLQQERDAAPLPQPGPQRPILRSGPLAEPRPAPPVVVPAPSDRPMPPDMRRGRPDHAFFLPMPPRPRGLFGLAPAPFVQGEFVAALKVSDGHWAVVRPQPEPFPNSWQRRVLLWFLISLALVMPLGLLFARRLARPIAGFASAAERLGRDPRAPVLAVEGPAEIGRAAHAFNRMQSRLRSFVDDRTAMIGAISHDLRTPLTRLRFRLEDVPEPLQAGMLMEVEEMEAMIKSVLHFIRDASEPGIRERLDLRTIVEDVVEDAVFIGGNVTLADCADVPVEVDPLSIRRLFGNLLENAVKYGGRAEVRLLTDGQDAIAEVRDGGPGLPEEELERVFQPFYRSPAARASKTEGSGLGLAICRSIARAHGGDVQLRNGEHGLVAQVRLPLVYGTA